MLSYFRWVLFFVALFATLMGGALYLGRALLTADGPLQATKTVVIPRGAGPTTMAKVLREEGIISHSRLFRVALMIDPNPKPIKAGEYEIPARTSMQALVELLQSGKVVQRRLTVVEGATTAEVIELVRKTEALTGEITLDVKEGDLLPETYFYSREDTRDGLLLRMKEAMDKTLDAAWRKQLEHWRARLRHADAVLRNMQPRRRVGLLRQRLEALRQRPRSVIARRLQHDAMHLRGLARSLEAVSPLATVARGYAILLREDGHVVRSVHEAKVGDRVQARLTDGSLPLRVIAPDD